MRRTAGEGGQDLKVVTEEEKESLKCRLALTEPSADAYTG